MLVGVHLHHNRNEAVLKLRKMKISFQQPRDKKTEFDGKEFEIIETKDFEDTHYPKHSSRYYTFLHKGKRYTAETWPNAENKPEKVKVVMENNRRAQNRWFKEFTIN